MPPPILSGSSPEDDPLVVRVVQEVELSAHAELSAEGWAVHADAAGHELVRGRRVTGFQTRMSPFRPCIAHRPVG